MPFINLWKQVISRVVVSRFSRICEVLVSSVSGKRLEICYLVRLKEQDFMVHRMHLLYSRGESQSSICETEIRSHRPKIQLEPPTINVEREVPGGVLKI